MSMSIPYTATGRTAQKKRTREALVEAARQLLAEGITPGVVQTAERAGISRATAYRYFDNQRLLIQAAAPYIEATSLLPPDAPEAPVGRVGMVAAEILRITVESEPELRAMLRLSLDPAPSNHDLVLRQGRRYRWFEDALSPLKERLSEQRFRSLVLSVAAATGIESLVWLTDVAGVTRPEATALLTETARTLTRAAIDEASRQDGSTAES